MSIALDNKEKELNSLFESEKAAAAQLSEQIKSLQEQLAAKMTNITRIQGAYGVIRELQKDEENSVTPEAQ